MPVATSSSCLLVERRVLEAPGEKGTDTATPVEAWDAFAGFRVGAIDAATPLTVFPADVIIAVLALIQDGAVELRALAVDHVVHYHLVVRCTCTDEPTAVAEGLAVATAVAELVHLMRPGTELHALPVDELQAVLRPFSRLAGGDLRRRQMEIRLDGEGAASVPQLFAAAGGVCDDLVEALAAQPAGACLSLSAAGAVLLPEERDYFDDHLGRTERLVYRPPSDGVSPNNVGDSAGEERRSTLQALLRAAKTIDQPVGEPAQTVLLRLSLASPPPFSRVLAAIAAGAYASSDGANEFVPAADALDARVLANNIQRVAFEPWGRAGGAASVRRACYLASSGEARAAMSLPSPTDGLPHSVQVHYPAPHRVPNGITSQGLVMGVNTFGSRERAIAFSEADRLQHVWVCGQTGAGKSTLLERMIAHDIEVGHGCCVVDPHGDLAEAVLGHVPPERAADVMLFDASDEAHPPALNLFQAKTPREQDRAIQDLIAMLYRVYDPGHIGIMGPRFENWFRCGALTAMAYPGGATILDIPRLFVDKKFLDSRLDHVKDPIVRQFWLGEMAHTTDFHVSEMLGWFLAKFSALTVDKQMRSILGAPSSSLDLDHAMNDSGIVIANLAKGLLGEINAMWLGMLLLSRLHMAGMKRAALPKDERPTFYLYLDEFQSFAATTVDEMLSETRKYGLAITLANQAVEQLPERLRAALFGNVQNLVVFRPGVRDAAVLAAELGGAFTARELMRMQNYRAVCRMAVGGVVQDAFDMRSLLPPAHPGLLPGSAGMERANGRRVAREEGEGGNATPRSSAVTDGATCPAGATSILANRIPLPWECPRCGQVH